VACFLLSCVYFFFIVQLFYYQNNKVTYQQCYLVLLVQHILSSRRVVLRENTTLFKTKSLQDKGVRGTVAVLTLQGPDFFACSLNRKITKLFRLHSHKM